MTDEEWFKEFKETREKLESKMEDWKNEMVDIVNKYNIDIACIREIKDENEKNKLTFWYIYRKSLGAGIILFLFLAGLAVFFHSTKVCGDVEIPIPFVGQPVKYSSQKGC